ncbi:WD repeat-containing protein 76 [Parus major]|uniref:WD repeat-containing protein 76 n=1 Tax=Parus major TaxID=9157 RepID=UPI0007710B6B|nr:WD repeat-containing protein 76 [Parus major]
MLRVPKAEAASVLARSCSRAGLFWKGQVGKEKRSPGAAAAGAGALKALGTLRALRGLKALGTLRALRGLRALGTLRGLRALGTLRALRGLRALKEGSESAEGAESAEGSGRATGAEGLPKARPALRALKALGALPALRAVPAGPPLCGREAPLRPARAMALSQPGPPEPEEPSAHSGQQPQVRGREERGRGRRGVRWEESRGLAGEGIREELGCEERNRREVRSGEGGVQGPAVPGVAPRVPADSRSPSQESLPSGPAEPPSSLQKSPSSSPADPPSSLQESPSSGPAEPPSPPQQSQTSGPAEPPEPPQESPSSGPAEPPSPQQQFQTSGPAEPPSPPPRGPAGKRLRPEPDSGPRAPPGSPPGPSSAARGQDGLWDADSDGSDGGDAAPDGNSHLSAYERKRLKNITENAKFFAALKLHESAARLEQLTTKRRSYVTKRAKPKKVEDEPAPRRSRRLLRVEPLDIPLLETFTQPAAEEYPQVPVGPLPMVPEDQAENSKWTEALLGTWMRISELKAECADRGTPDIKRYQESLSSMVLSEENIRKVVKARVCSMAIHPSENTILVAAGDKLGHIGLWNVSCRTEEGHHMFIPHSFQVNCMHFSPCNPAHLLSLSNDTLRCGDVTRAVFDEICRSEDSFSCFDFLEEHACSALVSQWGGAVAVVDTRTPGASSELSADIGFGRTRTVHVHPVNKHYFLAAGLLDVCVFDVRYLKAKGNKPLSSLTGHTKSVASAYFSPVTGSRVVTVCADDKLRVYDTTSLSPTAKLLSSIRHNNNTGRWLTRFRAIWDPKQEHCFLVGSMAQPRQIQVFQDTGKLLHSFCNVDCLASVCSINVVHPSQNILVGGNSSGRLHVFK